MVGYRTYYTVQAASELRVGRRFRGYNAFMIENLLRKGDDDSMAKMLNATLRFLLELCALAALCYWGFYTGGTVWLKVSWGIGAPSLFAVIWGIWIAPKAFNRLATPFRLILEIVLFSFSAAALMNAGHPVTAVLFLLLFVMNRIFIVIWKQPL